MSLSRRLVWSACARVGVAFEAFRRQEGQTFTEYAVIVAVITVGTVAAVGVLRDAVTNALTAAANGI